MSFRLPKAVFVTLFLLGLGRPTQAALELIFSTTTILPGQTLRVEANGIDPNQKARIAFAKGFYPLFAIGPDAQRGLIGIRLDAAPRVYPLKAQIYSKKLGRWETISESTIEISSRVFQTENVNFTSQKTDLMRWEKQESAKIRKLLMTVTRDQRWEAQFDLPVDGPIITDFGIQRLRNGKIPAGFHKGYDLRAKTGTPIYAPAAGTVLLASSMRAHGKTILVDHGQGVMTIYLHMSSMSVVPGKKVVKGQKIGEVGSTGLSTAPHLHWGLYVHTVAVDAKEWMEKEF